MIKDLLDRFVLLRLSFNFLNENDLNAFDNIDEKMNSRNLFYSYVAS